jgi:hypothetical protein
MEDYTLIVSDVHEDTAKLAKILKKYDWIKKKVINGDWVDSHTMYREFPEEHLEVLQEILKDDSFVYLVGNHDMQYLFPEINALGCSGWRRPTEEAFKKMITGELRDKMLRLHYWIDTQGKSWLVSHAGFNPKKVTHPVTGITREYIDQVAEAALEKLRRRTMTDLVEAGEGRGGSRGAVGGVTWQDWNREFEPIEGINQIVGHTRGREVRKKEGLNSENYCIDTLLDYVAIVDGNGEVIIEKST